MPEHSLRDLFAMAAMAGDLASTLGHLEEKDDEELQGRAQFYYRMADAMMDERGGGGPRLVGNG